VLILTRKTGETLAIRFDGKEVEVHILSTHTGRVSLGFIAPKEITIARGRIKNPASMAGGVIG